MSSKAFRTTDEIKKEKTMLEKSIQTGLRESIELSKRFDAKMREHGATLYNALFNVLIILLIFIGIAIYLNVIGWSFVNIGLSFLSLIGGALALTHPKFLITVANIDLLINRILPQKLQIDAMDALLDTYLRISRRILIFCGSLFLFLGIVPIGDNLKIFFITLISVIILLLININNKIANKSEGVTKLEKSVSTFFAVVVLCSLGYIALDAIMSNNRVQTRVDKMAGGSLIRSLKLSKSQITAHQILEQSAENTNLSCLGTTPELRVTNLSNMITIVNNGGEITNITDKRCLEQVLDGRASFLNIVSKRVSSIGDYFEKNIFDEDVFPQFGGTPLVHIKAGYQYTIVLSGVRQQRASGNGTWGWQRVLPNGSLIDHANAVMISDDPVYQRAILAGNKPVYMAVLLLNNERYFAHGNKVTFTAKEDGMLRLTVNCRQAPIYFNESKGFWHVSVAEVKI